MKQQQQHHHAQQILPSTGLDILLVGHSFLCQPLAESLLRCSFIRRRNYSVSTRRTKTSAIEALRSHICNQTNNENYASNNSQSLITKRHIHMVESFYDIKFDAGNSPSESEIYTENKDSGNNKDNNKEGIDNNSNSFGSTGRNTSNDNTMSKSKESLGMTKTSKLARNDQTISTQSASLCGLRIDHIVLVISSIIDFGIESSKKMLNDASMLFDHDCFLLGRLSIVFVTGTATTKQQQRDLQFESALLAAKTAMVEGRTTSGSRSKKNKNISTAKRTKRKKPLSPSPASSSFETKMKKNGEDIENGTHMPLVHDDRRAKLDEEKSTIVVRKASAARTSYTQPSQIPDFVSSVPMFNCQSINDKSTLATLSHMILQRTKLSCRQGAVEETLSTSSEDHKSALLPGSPSPMLFARF